MASTTVQETQAPSPTNTITSDNSSPVTKFRQIAPAPTGKPEYDIYHIPKGYEVLLVPKNNDISNNSNVSTLDNKSSSPSSWRKRKNNGHIPRPKNCFMAYREQMQHNILAENPGMNNKLVSVIAAKMWNSESEDVKQYWKEHAQQLKIEHMNKYPDYKFAPKKKAQKNLNALNSSLGIKAPKNIQKKYPSQSQIFSNEISRRNVENYLIDHSHTENTSAYWTGHFRSSSVESASSWTSNDSIPNTPPTFCDRSSLRYESNDWDRMYDDFSLNIDPNSHLTAVSSAAAGFYETLLPSDYNNSIQVDSSESSYYITEEEDNYEDYLQQDTNQLLNTLVLTSQTY
ncbi:7285_t:CDS:2 [Funneliformis geosporum]|uniref:15730_t:CDS:1 n=1 Tax=Funneliformis geosporum TaxID=1117311 RepID=A0A9W4SH09_9GLOM|nr:15730_t:CDS:2 [Funneliformis geosporum]CAI2170285.1 7285_t:CDS:2 [Funneliformis geosporum]